MRNYFANRFAKLFLNLLTFLFIFSVGAFAQQRLVLVGGGKRPPAAIQKFVEWAGKDNAKILIITWASGVPQESFDGIKKDFESYKTASFENAPTAPLDAEKRAQFINQLKSATGIFFTGGDQNRIMDILQDAELYNVLREKYKNGAVFGGTSAGTAVMSDPMMTGEADLKIIDPTKITTRKGLGLIPNVILDQHFIIRQRENRLFSLILQNPQTLGIGINEDMAMLVSDNRRAEAVGPTQVMIVDGKTSKATFQIFLLKSGDIFDLVKRKMRRKQL